MVVENKNVSVMYKIKMVLSGTKKTSNIRSIINQNQGGGDKKAGFPYQIGRDQWASIFFDTCNPLASGGCCNLKNLQFTKLPLANISRPIGAGAYPNVYWKIA
jgi:hypothetical protein